VPVDQPIGHLIVPPPADAVDEQINHHQAQESGQRERARREPKLVIRQPLPQLHRRRPAISRWIEREGVVPVVQRPS
jgi:hypothetical protein